MKLNLFITFVTLFSIAVSSQNYFQYNGVSDVNFRNASLGSGGRALVHGNGNSLILNYNGDFSGGTMLFGNVGINTFNSPEKLYIKQGLIRIDKANNIDNQSPGLVGNSDDDFVYNNKYLNHYGFGFHDGPIQNRLNCYMSGYWGINLFTEGKLRVRVDRLGNMGIGTETTTGYKLSVNGNIRASEVKVYTGWADYVFKEDYQLPTLDDVEDHIKKHGHLINIPSEADVDANGILLGEMNAKLLEKIEELTLYILDINKEVKNLKEENNFLKTMIHDKSN